MTQPPDAKMRTTLAALTKITRRVSVVADFGLRAKSSSMAEIHLLAQGFNTTFSLVRCAYSLKSGAINVSAEWLSALYRGLEMLARARGED